MNPLDKFITGETASHVAVVRYMALQFPYELFHHSPNEGKRSPFERYVFSLMGVSRGFPDFIFVKGSRTLAIEMKYKNNTPTPFQETWLKYYTTNQLGGFCCWNSGIAIQIINDFYNGYSPDNLDALWLKYNGYFVHINDDIPTKIKKLL